MPFSPPKPDEIEQAGFTPPSPDDVLDPLDKPFGSRGVTTAPKIRTPIPLGPTPPAQPGVMARAADALETVGNFPGRMLRGVYNAGSELTHAYPPLQPGDSLLPDEITDAVKQQADWATRPGGVTPVVPPKTDFSQAMGNVAAKTEKSLTTPESVASLPFFELKAVRAAMLASQVAHTPQLVKQIADTFKNPKATPQQKWESLGDAGMNLAMTAGLALSLKPADVRTKFTPEEAAKIAETKTSEPTPPSELAHNEPNQPEAVPAPAAPVASETPAPPVEEIKPPQPTAETLMKLETGNAVKPADEVQDYFAPDVEQVPVKEPETPIAPIVDQPVNKTESAKFFGNLESGETFGDNTILANEKVKRNAQKIADEQGGKVQGYLDGKHKRGWVVTKPTAEVSKAVETPIAVEAKVQEHVDEVAKTDGQRPAKEVKSELVQRLEKAIEEAPSRTDLTEQQLKALNEAENPRRHGYSGNNRAEYSKHVASIESERSQLAQMAEDAGVKRITIDIPGDGKFTIWNTKEHLGDVLKRAKKLSTVSVAPEKTAFKTVKSSGNFTPDVWATSSEPTHEVMVGALEGKKPVEKSRKGKPITVKGHEDKTFYLTSDGEEFRITEPQTGLSVGTGDTIKKAVEDAQEKLASLKVPFEESIKSGLANYGKRTPPRLLSETKPQMTGMGGAVPAEFEKPGTFVSNMFAAIDRDREQMGKPPMPETKARSWDADNTKALAKMNAEPNWIPDLIQQVKQSPRPLLSWENAGMVWQRAKWKAEANNALARIAQAFDDGRQDDLREAEIHNAVLEDKLNELDEAVGRNGTGSEAGRSLQAQKMASGDDFSLVEMRLQKRAANNGKPLTPQQSKEIADLHQKLQEAQAALDKHLIETQERISKMQADAELNRIKAEAAAAPRPAINPKVLAIAQGILDKWDRSADQARASLKSRLGRTSAGIDPTLLVDLAKIGRSYLGHAALDVAEFGAKLVSEFGDLVKPHIQEIFDASNKLIDQGEKTALDKAREMRGKSPEDQIKANAEKIAEKVNAGKKNEVAWYVQRIARLLLETGVKEREELIDRVHELLKQSMPDITRREAMDALSGYGDFRQLSKDQISVQLRGMKGEMLEIAKLEDMAQGKPPLKSGVARGETTEARRQLIKKVNEAKFKFQVPMDNPATQLKSALDTFKTTMRNRIADLEDKIARKDYAKAPRRELQLDNQAFRLKEQAERLKLKFRQDLMRDRLAKRPAWEKIMEQVSGTARASALSGYHTLLKLAGYDLAKFVETPATEVVGGGLSKVPGLKPIFQKATLESGPTLKAIVDFYTGVAIKGMKEAWQTLRRGGSQSKILYGKPQVRPPQWFDFFGNLHMAEKTPLLTGTHEMYIRRLTVNAIKNGLDPANEFVRAAINKEAYEYSQKSILQENNKFAEAVSMLHTRLEKANPKTGQVDIANATISTLVKTFLTKGIVRTPANYFSQTIARTPAGLITGLVKAGMAHYRGIGNLHPIEANAISALLKTGAVGSAFFLLGMIDATKKPEDRTFGGYWEPGRKRDGKDVEWGKIRIFGVTLPHLVTHNPLTEVAQMGTTTMRVAMSKFNKHDQETQGMAAGAVKALVGLAGKAPVASPLMRVGEARSNVAGDFLQGLVPQLLQNIAEDTDSEKRSPKTAIQSVEMGIPGLRQNVPKAKK